MPVGQRNKNALDDVLAIDQYHRFLGVCARLWGLAGVAIDGGSDVGAATARQDLDLASAAVSFPCGGSKV